MRPTLIGLFILAKESLPVGVGRRLGAVCAARLGEDVADVADHCVLADDKHLRDLLVAFGAAFPFGAPSGRLN